MNLRNYLARLISERNSRRAGGAGPPSNLNAFNNNQLNQAIENLQVALAEIGTHIGRNDPRRRHSKRTYKTPRTHGSRIEKRLQQRRKVIKNMEENKRWGSKVGLAAQRIYARKLRRMVPKKWPTRLSRMLPTVTRRSNNSNSNNLKVTGQGGATWRQLAEAIENNNEQNAERLRRRLRATPRSPRTAAATVREAQRYVNGMGFGQESGTEAPNPRQKTAYSSGSSSRNSKTPSPSSSARSKNASPGSAVSTGRKNNSLNK